jgi:exopolysaccharide biosynthesis protein
MSAESMGIITPHAFPSHFSYAKHPVSRAASSHKAAPPPVSHASHAVTAHDTKRAVSTKAGRKKGAAKKAPAKAAVAARAIDPQGFTDSFSQETLAPGVVHKFVRGALSINILDVDMKNAPVKVQPNLAGESFDRLKDVADHAKESNAIAAINANYFKTNGTPLGTLIIDGEWVAGPLFDRVSMGISTNGDVKIDRVSLQGTLTSNNPEAPSIWLNNINQPRRHGTHLVLYTRRWGSFVRMAYEGTLVAVNAQGEVQDKSPQEMAIPYGGYVLSDCKDSKISKLNRGDRVQVAWQTSPNDWHDVVEAVSGGPMLVKDGKVFLDLQDENFRRNWTGSQIKARTAIGVTADHHLIMATIEGPHTLWDFAKFLHKLGAVDAMNLDGGGSTTMVVHGKTVTRNANDNQRRVASSIVLVDLRMAAERTVGTSFRNGVTPAAASYGMAMPPIQVSRAPEPVITTVTTSTTTTTTNSAAAASAPIETAQVPDDSDVLSPVEAAEPIRPEKKHKLFGLLGH